MYPTNSANAEVPPHGATALEVEFEDIPRVRLKALVRILASDTHRDDV